MIAVSLAVWVYGSVVGAALFTAGALFGAWRSSPDCDCDDRPTHPKQH